MLKVIKLVMLSVLVVAVSACGSDSGANKNADNAKGQEPAQTTSEANADTAAEPAKEEGKADAGSGEDTKPAESKPAEKPAGGKDDKIKADGKPPTKAEQIQAAKEKKQELRDRIEAQKKDDKGRPSRPAVKNPDGSYSFPREDGIPNALSYADVLKLVKAHGVKITKENRRGDEGVINFDKGSIFIVTSQNQLNALNRLPNGHSACNVYFKTDSKTRIELKDLTDAVLAACKKG